MYENLAGYYFIAFAKRITSL